MSLVEAEGVERLLGEAAAARLSDALEQAVAIRGRASDLLGRHGRWDLVSILPGR